jgi:predicted metal-dependent hydrolase
VRVNNHLCVPPGDTNATRSRVRNWYRDQADKVFLKIMASWQDLPWLEGQVPTWRHRFMKSQWGSCSARGRISLNTHLVRTPERLIEYVTLHEICHLKHHNHSRRFHALMGMHMEDWPERSQELRRNLSLLLDE